MLFLAFIAVPIAGIIAFSFFQWDLLTPPKFAGLANFRMLAHDPELAQALFNSLIFDLMTTTLHIIVGMTLAIAVTSVSSRVVRYWARTAFVVPFLMSAGAVAVMWSYILSGSTGPLNYYLERLGMSPPDWLASGTWALPSLVGVDLWQTVGITFIIFLVGLQTIPAVLYEAAAIDGVGAFQRFRYVTFPMLSPATLVASVTAFIGAFEIFTWPYVITNGGPGNATLTIMVYIFRVAFRNLQLGYGAAVSIVNLVVLVTLVMIGLGSPAAGCIMSASRAVPLAGPVVLGRRARRVRSRRWLVSAALVLGGCLMLLPELWVLVNSFLPSSMQFNLPPVWFTTHLTLASYRQLFDLIPFLLQLLNSVGVTVAVVVGATLVSILAAYAFARLEFWGRDVLFVALLAGLMLPVQIAAVPEFVEIKYLGLLNSRLSLVIPALIQVFGIFLLREHFKTIPRELEEAARIEGAGELQILRLVVVPLSWPAISAVAIITAQYIWNDFFWPNLYITSPTRMVAALGLVTLQNAYLSGPVGAIFAGLSILVIPVVAFFAFVQRQLMEGLGFAGVAR